MYFPVSIFRLILPFTKNHSLSSSTHCGNHLVLFLSSISTFYLGCAFRIFRVPDAYFFLLQAHTRCGVHLTYHVSLSCILSICFSVSIIFEVLTTCHWYRPVVLLEQIVGKSDTSLSDLCYVLQSPRQLSTFFSPSLPKTGIYPLFYMPLKHRITSPSFESDQHFQV